MSLFEMLIVIVLFVGSEFGLNFDVINVGDFCSFIFLWLYEFLVIGFNVEFINYFWLFIVGESSFVFRISSIGINILNVYLIILYMFEVCGEELVLLKGKWYGFLVEDVRIVVNLKWVVRDICISCWICKVKVSFFLFFF